MEESDGSHQVRYLKTMSQMDNGHANHLCLVQVDYNSHWSKWHLDHPGGASTAFCELEEIKQVAAGFQAFGLLAGSPDWPNELPG